MQANHGNVHKYLGMKLEYTTVGQVKTTMLDCTDEIINAFDRLDPTVGVTKSSSAPGIVFKVKKDGKTINTKKSV